MMNTPFTVRQATVCDKTYKGQSHVVARCTAGWLTSAAARLGFVGLAGLVSACISIDAPSEPIVIELNINIRQEVIYRLAEDADEVIEENAEIF